MPAQTNALKRIALLTSSLRTPTLGPSIRDFLNTTITPTLPENYSLHHVSLIDYPLSLSTAEPSFPILIPQPLGESPYKDENTNVWSRVIRDFDAVIFITPQYNQSIPASLKNAIDHIYHEWSHKPALIVSYGGHGGNKAANHLREILNGLKMKVCETTIGFALGNSVMQQAVNKETIESWKPLQENVLKGWKEMATQLEAPKENV